MRWFGRRRQAFDPLGERVTREVELTVTSPRVTAAEALALCRPVALDVDERATLKMVVGHDITPDGESHRWDLLFDGRGVLANVNVDLVLDRDDDPPIARLLAIPNVPADPESVMRRLWERLDDGGRRQLLDGWFGHDPLPEELDSVAAMASFADEGFDLVSGPTDVVLAAMQTEDGPIWRLTVGRDEATRPLT